MDSKQKQRISSYPSITYPLKSIKVTSPYGYRRDPFTGILFCADCGSVMYQQRYQTDKRKQDCYICGNYKKRTHDCTAHFIRTDLLTAGVLSNLRKVTSYAAKHGHQGLSASTARQALLFFEFDRTLSAVDRRFLNDSQDH